MYKFLALLMSPVFAAPSIPRNFFQMKGEWTRFNRSTLYEPVIAGNRVSSEVITANVHFNHLFNRSAGFRLGTGYDGLKLDWENNPLTTQKLFSYAQMSIGFFLMSVENWDIYTELGVSLDTHHTDWSDYALYNAILYTKYDFEGKFNLHAGFTGYYGIRYNRVIPIVGVDFKIGPRFHMHAVFPHDMAFEYMPTSYFSALLKARLIETPRRLAPTALRPKGAIEYKNTGAEFALKFHYTNQIGILGYVGRTICGHIKAEDEDGSDLTYYRFRSSTYFGANVFCAF